MQWLWKSSRQDADDGEELPVDNAPQDEDFDWGGTRLPFSEATGHFMYLAATGGGKTINIRLQMQSVLPSIGEGNDSRALIYDPKQDMLPLLHAMCQRARIFTTNPFDARGVAWDLAADVREPRVAVEIVFTLIPHSHESQPFFSDAARHLMYGVIVSFTLSGHEWTFADLLRAVSSARKLKAILKRHPQTRDIATRYFGDKRLLSNIMSTLATKLLAFEPIAAAWEDAKEKVSLHQWAKDESILVLANSEISRTAIDAINRCMFKRATDITLSQSESFTRRNWFILDEVTEAGRLDGLVSLLKRGRSKGCCVALAMQSIAGLRDPKLYGPNFAAEILGQIGHKFIGRLECPETAEWVSRLFGEQEIDQVTTSRTSSNNGDSSTTNQQIVTRRAVLPAELMDIDPCNRQNGLTGYYMSRHAGCYTTNLPADELFDEALIPPDSSVPEFIERRVEAQYLRPWTDDEAAKFGVPLPKVTSDESPQHLKKANLDLLNELDDLDGRPK